jgi:DNA-binding NtrC family response regulator
VSEKILVVEDEPEMRQILERFFSRKGYEVHSAEGGEAAWRAIEETMFDLVISDLAMEDLNGMDLLERVRATDSTLPFIIITGVGTIESAVEAIKLGAFHYITKPFKLQEIEILTKRALEYGKLHRTLDNLRLQEEDEQMPQMVVGSSKGMREVMRHVGKISDSQAPVLIQGETGTGKGVLARKIHENSSRRERPFLTIDCGALTDTLLESELFGHVKGAFTGAIRAKRGLLEEAHEGTVFLDEISEIRLPTQVKLLRAIQEREIKPVGGNRSIQVDVRFISATSRDLKAEVEKGLFREELYYRLAVLPLYLPPLRERLEDIPLLIDYFLKIFCKMYRKRISKVESNVLQMLYSLPWKGNIRELKNILERGVLLTENEVLSIDCLNPILNKHFKSKDSGGTEMLYLKQAVEEAEKKAIIQALKTTNNNRTQAARLLGVSRRTFYDKMAFYDLKV